MTAQETIDQFRSDYYADCSSARAAVLFASAYKRICSDMGLRKTDGFIPMVADQRAYAISDQFLNIFEVYYDTSDDYSMPLVPTTGPILFGMDPQYKSTSGPPTHFYFEDQPSGDGSASKICFYPVPNSASDPTYPRVKAFGTLWVDLTGSDTMPTAMFDSDAVLFDMAFRYSIQRGDGRMAEWKALYDQIATRALMQVNGRPRGVRNVSFSYTRSNPFPVNR